MRKKLKQFGALTTTALLACSSVTGLTAWSAEHENRLIGAKSGVNPNEPAEDAQWEPAWQKLCSYDQFCHRLKNPRDSSWINPETAQIEILRQYRKEILEAAKLYHVDPHAIVASFLADEVIIPTHQEEVHQYLVDKALGKSPNAHFPLGLVYPVAANPVEGLAAKIEKRKPRSPKEIEELLSTPIGTIYYGAAVIRDAQDRYQAHGFDISKRTDVLATLYNLGKVDAKITALEDRIARAKALKAKGASDDDLAKAGLAPEMLNPRFNFFGLFAQKNATVINGILDPRQDRSPKKTTGAACGMEKASALAEYPSVQSVSKDFFKNDQAEVSRLTQGLLSKLQGPDISKEEFASAYQALKSEKSFCPRGSHESANSNGDFICQSSKKIDQADVDTFYVIGYTPAVEETDETDAAPAKFHVCTIEQLGLSRSAIAVFRSCGNRDIGDGRGMIKIKSAAVRISGRETFYGREAMPIAADAEQYVANSIPLDCYFPKNSDVARDARAVQSNAVKEQSPAANTKSAPSGGSSDTRSAQ